jgi:hypothetical protein
LAATDLSKEGNEVVAVVRILHDSRRVGEDWEAEEEIILNSRGVLLLVRRCGGLSELRRRRTYSGEAAIFHQCISNISEYFSRYVVPS